MPEYRVVEGLVTGLRRDYRQNRNEQGLIDMTNIVPTEWGGKQVVASIPLPSGSPPTNYPTINVSWPYPMVVHGEGNVLLCDRNNIYDGTSQTAVSFVGGTTLNTIGTKQWQFAPFESGIWFLTNGQYFIYRIPSNDDGGSVKPAVVSSFTAGTVANFKGRLVLGDIGTPPSKMTGFFNEWKEMDHAATRTIGENTSFDRSWLVYSDLGGTARDVPFFDFMSMFDQYGGNTITDDLKTDMNVVIRDALEKGTMGFFPIRNKGDIRRIQPIGDYLMVYTTKGVSRISITESGFVEDDMVDYGITSIGNAGGDMREHLFVDDSGHLNRTDANGNVERLGYDEYLTAVSGSGCLISVDPLDRFYNIANGTYGFMYTRTGLCKTPYYMPTSLWRDGPLYGPRILNNNYTTIIETDIFDGGFRGVHEVTHVRIATYDTTGWTVTPKWRLNKNDAFTSEAAVAFDDRGDARIKVSGIEFKLLFTVANVVSPVAEMERIEIEMRQGGKKKLRQLI